MTIFIEDSPRNLAKWITEQIDSGIVGGAVLDPFSTPLGSGGKRNAAAVAALVSGAGGRVLFNPLTHLVDLPGVADYRYYDDYDLWSSTRGDLSNPTAIADHLERVAGYQDSLGSPRVAPTVMVSSPSGADARVALAMADAAAQRGGEYWLSVAGDTQFWSAGAALDGFVGAIAQYQPQGWFLSVVRPTGVLPAPATRLEVSGLARTVRSLSDQAEVHIGHGDLAGLPGVAAGATSLGTGWDQRQMLVGTVHYAARDTSDNGFGSWYERPTIAGILGRLKKTEYESLLQRDRSLAMRVTPGLIDPLAIGKVYQHHVAQLAAIVGRIEAAVTPQLKYETLRDLYAAARNDWPLVKAAAISDLDYAHWVEELSAGLEIYRQDEGW